MTRLIPRARPLVARILSPRPFSTAPIASKDQNPPKDSLLDRNKINTESREYSKSQSDDASAGENDPAFNPDKTDPDIQRQAAGNTDQNANPLESSPANQELSKPQDQGDSEMSGSSSMHTGKSNETKRSGRGDA